MANAAIWAHVAVEAGRISRDATATKSTQPRFDLAMRFERIEGASDCGLLVVSEGIASSIKRLLHKRPRVIEMVKVEAIRPSIRRRAVVAVPNGARPRAARSERTNASERGGAAATNTHTHRHTPTPTHTHRHTHTHTHIFFALHPGRSLCQRFRHTAYPIRDAGLLVEQSFVLPRASQRAMLHASRITRRHASHHPQPAFRSVTFTTSPLYGKICFDPFRPPGCPSPSPHIAVTDGLPGWALGRLYKAVPRLGGRVPVEMHRLANGREGALLLRALPAVDVLARGAFRVPERLVIAIRDVRSEALDL